VHATDDGLNATVVLDKMLLSSGRQLLLTLERVQPENFYLPLVLLLASNLPFPSLNTNSPYQLGTAAIELASSMQQTFLFGVN
jgi:hypothetical protein